MGTLVGHVAPGLAFMVLGLWHLFNNIKLFCLNPNTFSSSPWFPFPTSKLKHLELYLIIFSSSLSISMELFIAPKNHQPFDSDGTIPSNHLHNFEHSSISLSFLIYAIFAIILDQSNPKPINKRLTILIASFSFAQELFLFHLHSTDHMGIEGQYHKLLQIIIFISLITTLMGISMPNSFLISFVRSSSIVFQGLWLILMGYMLWTPSLIPKGCFLRMENGHQVVKCSNEMALNRAKSLVNIGFSLFFVVIIIFVMSFYLILDGVYGENGDYLSLNTKEDEKEIEKTNDSCLVEMCKLYGGQDMEKIVN